MLPLFEMIACFHAKFKFGANSGKAILKPGCNEEKYEGDCAYLMCNSNQEIPCSHSEEYCFRNRIMCSVNPLLTQHFLTSASAETLGRFTYRTDFSAAIFEEKRSLWTCTMTINSICT